MATRTISAKEIVTDVRAGMDNAALIEKHRLSEKSLNAIFKKLLDSGALKPEELKGRKAVEMAWKCPACGKPQNKEFDECPECGAVCRKVEYEHPQPGRSGIQDKTKELIEASRVGNKEAVKLLLLQGADPNTRESLFGWTVVRSAVYLRNVDVVKVLLEFGAKVDSEDIRLARRRLFPELVEILEHHLHVGRPDTDMNSGSNTAPISQDNLNFDLFDDRQPNSVIPKIQEPQTSFCSNCGKEAKNSEARFCTSCGAKLGSESFDKLRDAETKTDYLNETAYYQIRFQEFDRKGGSFVPTWNWAAFLLFCIWYLVKGMWGKALLLFVLVIILSAILTPFLACPLCWGYAGVCGNYDLYLLMTKKTQWW